MNQINSKGIRLKEAEAAEEQLLEPGNPQEQVPKVRNPDKEIQTSILSFFKKK